MMIDQRQHAAGRQARTHRIHACVAERPDLLERSLLATVLLTRITLLFDFDSKYVSRYLTDTWQVGSSRPIHAQLSHLINKIE